MTLNTLADSMVRSPGRAALWGAGAIHSNAQPQCRYTQIGMSGELLCGKRLVTFVVADHEGQRCVRRGTLVGACCLWH
jgi:hypothetical protein